MLAGLGILLSHPFTKFALRLERNSRRRGAAIINSLQFASPEPGYGLTVACCQ